MIGSLRQLDDFDARHACELQPVKPARTGQHQTVVAAAATDGVSTGQVMGGKAEDVVANSPDEHVVPARSGDVDAILGRERECADDIVAAAAQDGDRAASGGGGHIRGQDQPIGAMGEFHLFDARHARKLPIEYDAGSIEDEPVDRRAGAADDRVAIIDMRGLEMKYVGFRRAEKDIIVIGGGCEGRHDESLPLVPASTTQNLPCFIARDYYPEGVDCSGWQAPRPRAIHRMADSASRILMRL